MTKHHPYQAAAYTVVFCEEKGHVISQHRLLRDIVFSADRENGPNLTTVWCSGAHSALLAHTCPHTFEHVNDSKVPDLPDLGDLKQGPQGARAWCFC